MALIVGIRRLLSIEPHKTGSSSKKIIFRLQITQNDRYQVKSFSIIVFQLLKYNRKSKKSQSNWNWVKIWLICELCSKLSSNIYPNICNVLTHLIVNNSLIMVYISLIYVTYLTLFYFYKTFVKAFLFLKKLPGFQFSALKSPLWNIWPPKA